MPPQPIILATGSYDRTIRFWEPSTGICVRQLQFQDSQINCLAVSLDKSRLAAAGCIHLKLFDLTSSAQTHIASVEGHTQNITGLGFMRNGCLYTCSEDGHIKVWDPKKLNARYDLDNKCPVTCVVLHPNQDEIICGDQLGRISVWRLSTADSVPNGAAILPAQQLCPSGDVAIRSIALNASGDLCCIANNMGAVFCATVAPLDGSDILKVVHHYRAHQKYILKCVLSPDSKLLATASADSTISLWQVPDELEKPWLLSKTMTGHHRWVWDVAFAQDSQYIVSVSSDHMGRLWDVNKEKSIVSYSGHHKPVTCVVLDEVQNAPKNNTSSKT